jgi:hypothetical protein
LCVKTPDRCILASAHKMATVSRHCTRANRARVANKDMEGFTSPTGN